jgi:putative amidase-like protein/IPT/TIG domain-containing protein
MSFLTARTMLTLTASAVALAAVAAAVVAPPGSPSRPQADVYFPPVVTDAAATTAALAGGAVVTLEGTRLDELTDVKVGGVRAELEVTSPTTATVIVPPAATYDEGTAALELWHDARKVETPEVEVVYEVQTPVDRQMAYAFDHWNDYNLAQYGDFNEWGGDCINFVSQTLVARGWQPTDEWFNDAQQDWAPAFVHVPSFDAWLRSHPEYGVTTLTLDQRDQVKIGDVVLFDWEGDGSLDHAQVVSRVTTLADGSIRIAMVGHNVDSEYRDLDVALSSAGQGQPGATAFFWSIP